MKALKSLFRKAKHARRTGRAQNLPADILLVVLQFTPAPCALSVCRAWRSAAQMIHFHTLHISPATRAIPPHILRFVRHIHIHATPLPPALTHAHPQVTSLTVTDCSTLTADALARYTALFPHLTALAIEPQHPARAAAINPPPHLAHIRGALPRTPTPLASIDLRAVAAPPHTAQAIAHSRHTLRALHLGAVTPTTLSAILADGASPIVYTRLATLEIHSVLGALAPHRAPESAAFPALSTVILGGAQAARLFAYLCRAARALECVRVRDVAVADLVAALGPHRRSLAAVCVGGCGGGSRGALGALLEFPALRSVECDVRCAAGALRVASARVRRVWLPNVRVDVAALLAVLADGQGIRELCCTLDGDVKSCAGLSLPKVVHENLSVLQLDWEGPGFNHVVDRIVRRLPAIRKYVLPPTHYMLYM